MQLFRYVAALAAVTLVVPQAFAATAISNMSV